MRGPASQEKRFYIHKEIVQVVLYNRTTHLRAKQIPKELTQKRNAKLFCKTDFSLLSQWNARKEKVDGGGGGGGGNKKHLLQRIACSEDQCQDSWLWTASCTLGTKPKPTSPTPKTRTIYQGGYLLKNPSRSSRFKWPYIDTPPTPLPKPNTTPKRMKAMGEFIPNHRLDFDCGPQH